MFSTVPPKRVSRLMHAARYWPSRRTTAVLATVLFKLLTRRRVLTHKLCGTHKDGSPR
jgi:hypothetical protein